MVDENQKHVCFVAPYAYSYFRPEISKKIGGAERQQHLLAQKLVNDGFDVSFMVFEEKGPLKEEIDGMSIWKVIPKIHYNEMFSILKFPIVLYKLIKYINKINADIYYIRGNPPLHALFSIVKLNTSIKHIYAVANDSDIDPAHLESYNPIIRELHLRSLSSSSEIIAQTEKQKGILVNEYNHNPRKIYNSYPLPKQEDIKPVKQRDYILWVGSIDPDQKKPMRFLRIAKSLPEKEFVMIGSPIDEDYYRRFEERASKIDNLDFKGFIDPDEIFDFYNDSIAVVNTSDYEGFPNVFLEAWRVGTPVISLYHDIDNNLESNRGGRLSGSLSQICADIDELYNDRQKASELGMEGRKLLKEKFSIDTMVDEYKEILVNLD